jgi:hypothetical protein
MTQLLPLLPSGPGGVHNLSLRGDRQELPSNMITDVITAAHYLEIHPANQALKIFDQAAPAE